MTVLGLAFLILIPAFAMARLESSVDRRLLIVVPIIVSVLTFILYRIDKRRAEAGEWRIPESTLHIAELAGGWPGSFLAQRLFRHKTAKASYQFVFWVIVLGYQVIAIDSLLGWRFTRTVMPLLDK